MMRKLYIFIILDFSNVSHNYVVYEMVIKHGPINVDLLSSSTNPKQDTSFIAWIAFSSLLFFTWRKV